MLSKIGTILAITGCAAESARHCEGDCRKSWTSPKMVELMTEKNEYWDECEMSGRCGGPSKSTANIPRGVASPCVDGKSNGAFPCRNIQLQSFLDIHELGFTERISDIWGWVDPLDNSEIAIGCGWQNTTFVDVTDPLNPLVLATLKDVTGMGSRWCDVKTYKDHAYVVRDSNPGHGIQVFDMTRLREARNVRQTTGEVQALDMDTHYTEHGSSHNIAINEATGFAFSIGGDTCNGGLHQIDLRNPKDPQFVGCFTDDGYTHDTQCVIYDGPDVEHVGKEICFGYNVRALTITDNSDKDNIEMLSREEYLGNEYCHQGWLTTDHSFAIMNDEGDERNYAPLEGRTRTLIWDVRDLDAPVQIGEYIANETSIDHNLYIWDTQPNLVYESNYCAGLRIMDLANVANGELVEVAYFDVEPECDSVVFEGTWSNYLFPSGNVVASNIYKGMFVLRVDDALVRAS